MKKILFLMMLSILVITGCAAKQVSPETDATITSYEPVVPHEVINRLNEANRLSDSGQYLDALRYYDELVDSYASKDDSFECGIHTNQAIAAAVGLGDRDQFLYYADQVQTACLDVNHPSSNTRWVLAVGQALRNERVRDLRVPTGMQEAAFQVLRGKGD